jgi:undecaprenyl-diphosphatase
MTNEIFSYLQSLDVALFQIINGFAGHSAALDHIADRPDDKLKGLAFMGTFGALWFQQTKMQVRQRETLILVLIAVFVSIMVARGFADMLPFRTRPMFEPGYRAPLFIRKTDFEDWSSFPSDTATLLFALTAGFWSVSRGWGVAWLLFSIAACVARVYFGVHYPSDVIAGAVIGTVVSLAINNEFLRTHIAAPIVAVEKRAPGFFYCLLFLFISEVSTLFVFTRAMRHLVTGLGS